MAASDVGSPVLGRLEDLVAEPTVPLEDDFALVGVGVGAGAGFSFHAAMNA